MSFGKLGVVYKKYPKSSVKAIDDAKYGSVLQPRVSLKYFIFIRL